MKTLLLLLLVFPITTFAEWKFGPSGPSHSSGASLGGSGVKFRFMGSAKLARATMMSKNDFVEKRSLNGIGVDALAGVSFGPLIIGGGAGYMKFYQSTDKKDVSGTDTTGDLTTLKAAVGLGLGKFCLMGTYFINADYKLAQKTSTNENSTYSKPDGSYGISLMYRPGGRSFWSLDYTNINFSEMKVGSTEAKLTDSDDQINLNYFGITYGFMF